MIREPQSGISTAMPGVALVLAGGLGTRLRPAVADRPKSLALAAGRPFLDYLLSYLAGQRIRRVVLCVGYMAQAVQETIGDGQAWGLQVQYSLEPSAMGTGGALRLASIGLEEPFFALNGDTLFRVDLAALWAAHQHAGGLATVALLRVTGSAAAVRGCVRLAEDGRILAFDEKPSIVEAQNDASLLVNGGVYVFEPQALADVPLGRAVSIEREVFPRLANQGQLAGCVQETYFADIGTPESLAAFERDVVDDEKLTAWLFANGGPILRYRMAVDQMVDTSQAERDQLLQDSLATPEVQRWLDNLRRSQSMHGSKDTNAENPLAKLLDFGFNRTVPAFDQVVQSLLYTPWKPWDDLVLYPFLLRAGYADHPPVAECLARRIELLVQTALRDDFDFYLSPAEAANVPKAWQGKPIYRDEFGSAAGYSLPTCYDFYALAYCPPLPTIENLSEKIDAIVAFLSDPRFQSTVGGYGWDRVNKRCYAAGRAFLACVEPSRLVMFMELGARFAAAQRSEWFQQGLATLNSYRTSQGTYRFPSSLLAEKTGYYIYSGSHMGMGEDRHAPQAMELESTFRMLNIQQRSRFTPPPPVHTPVGGSAGRR